MPTDPAPQPAPELIPVGIVASSEARGIVQLEDGTKLAIRIMIMGAAREKGRLDDAGMPVYQTQSMQHVTIVEVAAPLKKAG